jgi:hypothetical protein
VLMDLIWDLRLVVNKPCPVQAVALHMISSITAMRKWVHAWGAEYVTVTYTHS